MTRPPAEAIVLDTSVLSNFAHVDRLDLLVSLPRVVTVAAVERELEIGRRNSPVSRRGSRGARRDRPGRCTVPRIDAYRGGTARDARSGRGASPSRHRFDRWHDRHRRRRRTRDRETTRRGGDRIDRGSRPRRRIRRSHPETADSYLKRWIDDAGFRSPARDIDAFLDR
ncbi:PilT domain-containing protein [Halorubrum lipolyticum DSM 21995]|uniref:PilT domain-containing protein n=1 Tax=Halorubrum lipolyticum DSM 21995 TaxID=1227482 RepID=M0NUL0_9EURY|nr:PilT domain-containing protein [Halorubrum lipolyticum DSM 21995]